ncbi:IS110 family transposase [Actinomadura sp. NPDC048394]|uniref:IS110 family transposase n=1 Tax=Actinomadura sp. NPDC048394 TaxID=3158223 RepID=UPI003400D6F9
MAKPRWWAGVDWSEQHGHEVAVVDATGTPVARARIDDTPDGVRELLRLLAGLSSSHRHSRKQVPVAIETTRGLLVEALRRAGQPMIPLNTAMVARYRGRLTPTRRRKSDSGDALLLANIIRTDGELHRPMAQPSPTAEALKTLVLAHWHARRDQRLYDNRLRSALREYFPAAIQAWAKLPGRTLRPEARALLRVAPTPQAAAQLRWSRISRTLTDAGRTRQVIEHTDRLHALFREPALRQPAEVEQAMGERMLAILAQLDQVCRVADDLTARITEMFASHPHAPIYASMPGVGPIIGARLLAEIGDAPDRFGTARGLRAYAGAAPLTWASGGTSSVTMRTACNRRLKVTGHQWAFATLTRSPGARAHYDRRREAGDRYAAALRNLYGRLLTCLHHCLTEGELYREEVAFPAASALPAIPEPAIAAP